MPREDFMPRGDLRCESETSDELGASGHYVTLIAVSWSRRTLGPQSQPAALMELHCSLSLRHSDSHVAQPRWELVLLKRSQSSGYGF